MILLFYADQWDDLWRRRQQLAYGLSKSGLFEKVIYIERPLPPTSFIKYLFKKGDRDANARWGRIIKNRSLIDSSNEKITILTPISLLPLIDNKTLFTVSEKFRDLVTKWLVKRTVKNPSDKEICVYVSHPQINDSSIRMLRYKYLWYDCTENFLEYPGTAAEKSQILVTDKWLTQNASLVTTVSTQLFKDKKAFNKNVVLIQNAVDVELFAAQNKGGSVPEEMFHIKRPIFSFVGGLNEWSHDWDMLIEIAEKKSEWSFLLIGQVSLPKELIERLNKSKNIFLCGCKPYKALPSYLFNSDVCFQFYKTKHGSNTRNSQKLFLYFAAGKPIISTASADVEQYKDYVAIIHSADEFIVAAENLIKNGQFDFSDKYIKLMSENSWGARINELSVRLKEISNG